LKASAVVASANQKRAGHKPAEHLAPGASRASHPASGCQIASNLASDLAPAEPVEDLPLRQISVAEYGLDVATIVVHAAAHPKQFDVAGAALAIGAAAPLTEDIAAKSFFEGLLLIPLHVAQHSEMISPTIPI
jgi:hypothetical protein